MCGIAGVFAGGPRAAEVVRAMTVAMTHRGPDGDGFFDDPLVSLGMRRLAIVDVAGGQQPQCNENRTVWIVFNGEIYNHADLRPELAQHGHVFRTKSDTEVIVHSYEQWGIDGCLERLRGMFAFLLWDAERRELFAARDRLGIKPLYYTRLNNGEWRFASEIKALLIDPEVPRAVNTEAIGPYLLHQYVPAPATFFAGIHKLLGGHYLRLDASGVMTLRPFWRLSFEPAGESLSFADAAAQVHERVVEAVRLRLMSEVPLGCLLSGGLDSSIVTAAMARLNDGPVRTFTVGFPEMPELDERCYARSVAEHYGTAHTELDVSLDAAALIEQVVHFLDEPLADAAALPTYAICKAARRHVTVLLTGEGGDELFAGYPRYALSRAADALQYLPIAARARALETLGTLWPNGRAGVALGRLAADPGDPLARNALWSGVFTPAEVARLFPQADLSLPEPDTPSWPYSHDVPPRNGLHRLLYWDLRRWLVDDVLMKVDKMSMAASVEARVPFLDHQLVEYVAGLPPAYKLRWGRGKAVLREAFRNWLPAQIAARRKAAFSPPLDVWFRGPLGQLAAERMRARGSFCRMFLDGRVVEALIADHVTGAATNGRRLWTLLCAELWYGQWFGAGRSAYEPFIRRQQPRSVLVVGDLPSEGWPSMDRYARGLLDHLSAMERDYVVVPAPVNGCNGNGRVGIRRRYWDRLVAYPARLRLCRPDVIHVLDHTYAHILRKFGGSRSMVTVHDLWPLRRPRFRHSVRQLALDALARHMTKSLHAATLLCADSVFSAREVQELLEIAPERVRVVPLGVDEAFFMPAPPEDMRAFRRELFNDAAPRLLHVGSCDPRKNVEGLLHIVAEIHRYAPRARLLQVGGYFTAEHRGLISKLGLDRVIMQQPALTETALRLAYQAADVLLLPSLYEGFGFPILEAQASRLPVVCSNRGSLPEVAGNGAVCLDPNWPAEWVAAALDIVESRDRRHRLLESGHANACKYTWERTATDVAAIYEELLQA